MEPKDDWQWDSEDVIVQHVGAIAVYLNPKDHIVIRQESLISGEKDDFVIFPPEHARTVAKAILKAAGLPEKLADE